MSRSSGSSQESTSTTASSWTSRRAAARRPWNASGPHRRASASPTATTRVISAPPSGPPTPRPRPGSCSGTRFPTSRTWTCPATTASTPPSRSAGGRGRHTSPNGPGQSTPPWSRCGPFPPRRRRPAAPGPGRRRGGGGEAHLAQWPGAVDASLESLRAVPAPVAGALVRAVRGLAEGINGTTDIEVAALEAHGRLLGRIQDAAASGNPDASLGAAALARLLGHAESMPVDLGRLEERADQERDRLRTRLNRSEERRVGQEG